MKKIVIIFILLFAAHISFGQTAWIDPAPTDVTKTVRLYVDLSKTSNQSMDTVKGPFYIWTWMPVEHPAGHPLVNGLGAQAWKNSNDTLKMTRDSLKGARVWYYEMIPTEFYGVTASEVYSKGISFLVKPKDGGGFGDPDFKTEDLVLTVDPPKTERGVIYNVPQTVLLNEVTTIYYDNPKEEKATMQNLDANDCYVHIRAFDDLGGTYEASKFLEVHLNPRLQMKKQADGRFKLSFIPNRLLNIPTGTTILRIEFVVRKGSYTTNADRCDELEKAKAGCP